LNNNYDKFGTLNDRVVEEPNDRGENPMMRRSNSKMRFEQAKELDGAIGQAVGANMKADQQNQGNFLQFGHNDLDQQRRESAKREKQAEYQRFLAQQ
jgi:hypothetical protein